jgi:hypothetical protein
VDPVSLILTALIAGAAAAAKETGGSIVTDAYQGLKSLVLRRFSKPDAPELEAPAQHRAQLEARLRQADAGGDAELIARAQAVLAQTDPEGTKAGKYQVIVSGGQGVVVGDHTTNTMNFNG